MATHEHTLNIALGEVLETLRPCGWSVHSEETRTIWRSSKRPDILIEEGSGWPVTIEADKDSYDGAEADARARLGQVVKETRNPIESAIALVYPSEVGNLDGERLRLALRTTNALEYVLLSRARGKRVERTPKSGWLKGSARDLAMLVHRASIPTPRVERLGKILEDSVEEAVAAFTSRHSSHRAGALGADIADVLEQSDDQAGQTRRMAMTVIVNALVFHEALAATEFFVTEAGNGRRLRPLRELLPDGEFDIDALTSEWRLILDINYWPIFATASAIIVKLPEATAAPVLSSLRRGALRLARRGVITSRHLTGALTGVVFQRLISDRKLLAAFFTQPAAAALLAGLAIPVGRAPGGAEWGHDDEIASLKVGDFACGTGTLLSAAYQRISLLHEIHGGNPKSLHQPLMKKGLVGLDVLNIAVHLTAAALAGAYPDVPFEGECLLTMPCGKESQSIGSLELLARHVQPSLIERASATTSGGRQPEDVADLMTRVGHGTFDLIIMNPPFASPTNPELQDENAKIPAFSAFETDEAQQKELSARLSKLTKQVKGCGHGNAGLATNFIDLGHLKTTEGGTTAFVLPSTAMAGDSWSKTRRRWSEEYGELLVVSIADGGSEERSFSDDTGIAECLVIAKRCGANESSTDTVFVFLNEQPSSEVEASLLADLVHEKLDKPSQSSSSSLRLGTEHKGTVIRATSRGDEPWPFVGVRDIDLLTVATELEQGRLFLLGRPDQAPISVATTTIGKLGMRGKVHRDIEQDTRGGTLRGPFAIHRKAKSLYPTLPVNWGHKACRERRMVIEPEAEAELREVDAADLPKIKEKAAEVIATASRVHFNRDFQFNAHSHCVTITKRRTIGGQAWPTISLYDERHEAAFVLWSNSTLGLMMYWWIANKRQAGRGNIGVKKMPTVITLDTRTLSESQLAKAKKKFDALQSERFLPFNQIDEDEARKQLDRAVLVEVLGLPEWVVADGGPIDTLRGKLSREPQIQGVKQERVVFTQDGEDKVKPPKDVDPAR